MTAPEQDPRTSGTPRVGGIRRAPLLLHSPQVSVWAPGTASLLMPGLGPAPPVPGAKVQAASNLEGRDGEECGSRSRAHWGANSGFAYRCRQDGLRPRAVRTCGARRRGLGAAPPCPLPVPRLAVSSARPCQATSASGRVGSARSRTCVAAAGSADRSTVE